MTTQEESGQYLTTTQEVSVPPDHLGLIRTLPHYLGGIRTVTPKHSGGNRIPNHFRLHEDSAAAVLLQMKIFTRNKQQQKSGQCEPFET